MKKTGIIIGILLAGAAVAFAVTQPTALGLVTAVIENKTSAQMNAYAPSKTGQLVYCSDCLQSAICVATGTAAGAWVVPTATSTAVLGGLLGHCN